MIRYATITDIPDWIEIIKEVEHLFGKMVGEDGFEEAIGAAIQEDQVICWEDSETKKINGVIAISDKERSIEWLAVSTKAKCNGIGKQLLEKALNVLQKDKNDIYVQTFAANIQEGIPARKMYEKFNFVDYKEAGKNPAGIDTVIMKRNAG
jgi:ribosomal protein S18 acetylase RimI-like enzyme